MDQNVYLKKIGGVKRVEQAMQLSDFVRELAVENIKTKLGKKANKKQIQKELRKRLHPEI